MLFQLAGWDLSLRHYCYSKTIAVEVVKNCGILKVVHRLHWWLNLGCVKKRRIKDNPKITGLSPRKNGFAINWDGASGQELILEERVLFWIYSFKVPIKYLGHLSMAINIEIRSSEENSRLEIHIQKPWYLKLWEWIVTLIYTSRYC